MINSRSCYVVVVLAAFWRLLWTSAVAEDLRLNSTYQPASKAFPRLDSSVLLSLLAGASISYFPASGAGRGGTTHASQVLHHDYDSFPLRHVWLPQSAADISLLGFEAGDKGYRLPEGWCYRATDASLEPWKDLLFTWDAAFSSTRPFVLPQPKTNLVSCLALTSRIMLYLSLGLAAPLGPANVTAELQLLRLSLLARLSSDKILPAGLDASIVVRKLLGDADLYDGNDGPMAPVAMLFPPTPRPTAQRTPRPSRLPTPRPTVHPTASPPTRLSKPAPARPPTPLPKARPTRLPTPLPTNLLPPTASPTPLPTLPLSGPSRLDSVVVEIKALLEEGVEQAYIGNNIGRIFKTPSKESKAQDTYVTARRELLHFIFQLVRPGMWTPTKYVISPRAAKDVVETLVEALDSQLSTPTFPWPGLGNSLHVTGERIAAEFYKHYGWALEKAERGFNSSSSSATGPSYVCRLDTPTKHLILDIFHNTTRRSLDLKSNTKAGYDALRHIFTSLVKRQKAIIKVAKIRGEDNGTEALAAANAIDFFNQLKI